MKDLSGKVAVVTGAASGIGNALARACAAEGMAVVLADVEKVALDDAAHAIAASGAKTLAVRTDVSKATDVAALAAEALKAFGGVHVVCNNAGVSVAGLSWMQTIADWEWVLGVNLWGVIHGVRTFTPILLGQGTEGHIVNTASMAGLISGPGMGIYNVSKHGVVTLSETLYHELRMLGAPVGVSVLCPGWVNTRIIDSQRNRPAELSETIEAMPGRTEMEQAVRNLLAAGLSPDEVARRVLEAIRADRFWILPHADWARFAQMRAQDIVEGRNPSPAAIQGLTNPGAPR
jgi:NAD(P)-dependent dehydrogenase (short-subunit alcohol dehydrogenase family)